jgi:hypothetical protein
MNEHIRYTACIHIKVRHVEGILMIARRSVTWSDTHGRLLTYKGKMPEYLQPTFKHFWPSFYKPHKCNTQMTRGLRTCSPYSNNFAPWGAADRGSIWYRTASLLTRVYENHILHTIIVCVFVLCMYIMYDQRGFFILTRVGLMCTACIIHSQNKTTSDYIYMWPSHTRLYLLVFAIFSCRYVCTHRLGKDFSRTWLFIFGNCLLPWERSVSKD